MTSKNLNECSGCLIISTDENIALPPIGSTNAYNVDLDKPCFFVNNHYISPVQKCYTVKLPNPVSLEFCDRIRIKIKVPKHILGERYGYSLEDLAKVLRNNENFCAGLRFKSSDGCIDITRNAAEDTQLDIENSCGWINITIHYQVGEVDSSRQSICNLCEISYSLCFDPVKLKTLYGACYGGADEIAEFQSETCLEIVNEEAKRQVSITDGTNSAIITGPENFLCLTIVDDSNESATFDKLNKTLTVAYDFDSGSSGLLNPDVMPDGFSINSDAPSNPVDMKGEIAESGYTQQTSYVPKP